MSVVSPAKVVPQQDQESQTNSVGNNPTHVERPKRNSLTEQRYGKPCYPDSASDKTEDIESVCFVFPYVYTVLFVAVYLLVMLPFEAAFFAEQDLKTTFFITLFSVEYSLTILMIILIRKTSQKSQSLNQVLIKRKQHKALVMDIITLIPYEIFGWFSSNFVMLGLRLLRLVYIFRIPKVIHNAKSSLEKFAFSKMKLSMQRIIRLFFTILLTTHLFACVWYFTASRAGFESWKLACSLRDCTSIGSKYLLSYYWTTVTITTVQIYIYFFESLITFFYYLFFF